MQTSARTSLISEPLPPPDGELMMINLPVIDSLDSLVSLGSLGREEVDSFLDFPDILDFRD